MGQCSSRPSSATIAPATQSHPHCPSSVEDIITLSTAESYPMPAGYIKGGIIPEPPANEVGRLAALDDYGVLDTEPEEGFDNLARLASDICNTPVALVSFVDKDRQWFKSRIGPYPIVSVINQTINRLINQSIFHLFVIAAG